MAALDRDVLQAELKKKKICRFCLTVDASRLTNIYMRDTRIKASAPLPIQIMALASIEVFSTDDMPPYVCSDCTNMFDFCYQFKQMCKKADNLLRQFPLTGQWPTSLEKPILLNFSSVKPNKTTQVRIQHNAKPNSQEEYLKLPKKILNSSVMSIDVEEKDTDCAITFLDKIENNDELSFDDIQELVASEGVSEAEFVTTDNLPILPKAETATNKPKLLNKSSIRILNKDAEPENEPRLSLPKINKDAEGKTEIVAEILNIDDIYEGEADPNNAAVIETNVFPCNFCERTFPLLQLRDLHMKNHLRDRKFQCDFCEKSFFSKYDLQRHLFIHNGEKPYKCSVCGQGFSRTSLLTRHEKTHTDVPKYICVHCERSFISKDDMEKHLGRHKINRPFVCKICKKGFAFKQGLDRHEVVHSRQQPFPCEYCNESFSTSTKLSRHLTAHAGLRPYPCKYCKKSYLLSHHLTRHLRSHKNVKDTINIISFKCTRCNTSFDTRDELISHSASHADELNLSCPLCKDIFDNMAGLTGHIQDHSEGETYACEFCDLIFITADKLQSHTDLDHANEMEAYHADDRAKANKQNEDKDQTDSLEVTDEKLEKTINEFLCDDMHNDGNDLDNSLKKTIKVEAETPSRKIINKIIIKNPNDESVLIPLKQRKLNLTDGKLVTNKVKSQQNAPNSLLKRKVANTSGTSPSTTRSANQPSIKSLLKLSDSVTVSRSSEESPPPKASSAPKSRTLLSKKMVLTNLVPQPKKIKIENETSDPSGFSMPINDDSSKVTVDKKKGKIQKITVTKSQAAAMAREGRIKIKDGKIILQN